MQRTYLALAALGAGATLVTLQCLPLLANTLSSRTALEPIITAAGALPPPPPQIDPSESAGIVSLEVIPYTPPAGDS